MCEREREIYIHTFLFQRYFKTFRLSLHISPQTENLRIHNIATFMPLNVSNISGTIFFSDVQGGPNTRLKSEIIWNRTANLSGGLGHNIPLDLVNEFLNRDFKGLV